MDPTVIFKATYSGVPVLEMPCKGVPVMRRRSDSWMNATQILKVAGFDKPQRTRVLEREVQKGTHEKIQGGYGKYQGTWVPLERGIELSKQFGVDHLLAPLFEFQPSANASPPQAPKHITAPSTRAKITKAAAAARARANNDVPVHATPTLGGRNTNNSWSTFDPSLDEKTFNVPPPREATTRSWSTQSKLARSSTITRAKANMNNSHADDVPVSPHYNQTKRLILNLPSDHDKSLSPTPSDMSSSSRTPSPLGDLLVPYSNCDKGKGRELTECSVDLEDTRGHKRKYGSGGAIENVYREEDEEDDSAQYFDQDLTSPASAKYARLILDYFVSESSQIPEFLITPPADFDPNVVIDDDGHTALHWACAMGRIRIVKLLLSCGADIFRANKAGQTALMRAVMFTNNYDLRKFPELFESFHRSTINIDRNDRTVFHYVVDIALQKGKLHAARYYLETILERLSEYPKELADILNFQDEDGETALTLAARCRSKRLVKILLEHGANPKIANRDGKSAEDYIMEDEKFRALSPTQEFEGPPGTVLESQTKIEGERQLPLSAFPTPMSLEENQIPLQHYSETGKRIATQALPQMTAMIESLATSFDSELQEKDRDLEQANGLLSNIQEELMDGQNRIANFQTMLAEFNEKKTQVSELENELNSKLSKRYRFGWEKYVRDEEEREKRFKETRQEYLKQIPLEKGGEDDNEVVVRLNKLESENPDLVDILKVPDEIEVECDHLRNDLNELCEERVELFKEFINLSSDNVNEENEESSGRLNKYRKLISLGCGGIGLDEVDEVIDGLNHDGGGNGDHDDLLDSSIRSDRHQQNRHNLLRNHQPPSQQQNFLMN